MDAKLIGINIRELDRLAEIGEDDETGLDFGDLCADVLAPER